MDKYSFQIIPPHSGKVRQMRFEGKRLWLFFIAVALFCIVNFVALFTNLYFSLSANHNILLANTNDKLTERVGLAENRADSLASLLEKLYDFGEGVRQFADIPPLSKPAYGIGGPDLDKLKPGEPLILAKAKNIDRKLDSLLIAAALESEALSAAREKIEKNRKIFSQTPSIWPMRGYISSGFGKRLDPFTGIWKMHEGIDICGRKGTPIRATADGRIKFAGWYHGYGNTVKIDHTYYSTEYAHLHEIKVRPGERVKRGDIIGTCGNSGYATGVHLHYEVHVAGKPVDSKKYLLPDVVVD